jgi:hypothetical protein
MKAKQHFGVRRMPVPGKVCAEYITRSEKRNARKDKKLWEFLLYRYKRDKGLAKKAMSIIKGRGLGELEMFIIADEFDEWWNGKWKYVMEDGEWVVKRQKKGERHHRKKRPWKKALSVINENRKEAKRTETDRFIKSFGSSSYSKARGKS